VLNHREVLEALLAGETLVDIYYKDVTLRFDGATLVATGAYYQPAGCVVDVCLTNWEVKPRTININGYEVPEPIRVKPSLGDKYYITFLTNNTVESYFFSDNTTDNRWFKLGFLHKTREAAELHLEALLSFTKHE
jgi:hypothetical protein